MDILHRFKKKLADGDAVFGIFMKTCDTCFVEVAGLAGFDFVILDMEHGPVGYENLQGLIRAAVHAHTLPIVRTPDSAEISISKPLDLGASGVQVPHIKNAESARAAVSAARFFPAGERGMCRYVRAANYSAMSKEEYFSRANEILVILQLEGKEAIANLDGILEVEGIDILFIGPYDLSQSMGLPGQVDHPDVVETMGSIIRKAQTKGKTIGTFTDTIDSAGLWKRAGVQYLSHSVDVRIFLEGCKSLSDELSSLG